MALRTGHGTGAGSPRVEVLPADELPAPCPRRWQDLPGRYDAARTASSPIRSPPGRSDAAGARRRRGASAWSTRSGYRASSSGPPSDRTALRRRSSCRTIAPRSRGRPAGSLVPPRRRWWHPQGCSSRRRDGRSTGAPRTTTPRSSSSAQALANDSRQNLLAAYELATREAAARRSAQPTSAHGALAAVLGGKGIE